VPSRSTRPLHYLRSSRWLFLTVDTHLPPPSPQGQLSPLVFPVFPVPPASSPSSFLYFPAPPLFLFPRGPLIHCPPLFRFFPPRTTLPLLHLPTLASLPPFSSFHHPSFSPYPTPPSPPNSLSPPPPVPVSITCSTPSPLSPFIHLPPPPQFPPVLPLPHPPLPFSPPAFVSRHPYSLLLPFPSFLFFLLPLCPPRPTRLAPF